MRRCIILVYEFVIHPQIKGEHRGCISEITCAFCSTAQMVCGRTETGCNIACRLASCAHPRSRERSNQSYHVSCVVRRSGCGRFFCCARCNETSAVRTLRAKRLDLRPSSLPVVFFSAVVRCAARVPLHGTSSVAVSAANHTHTRAFAIVQVSCAVKWTRTTRQCGSSFDSGLCCMLHQSAAGIRERACAFYAAGAHDLFIFIISNSGHTIACVRACEWCL